jgi:RsiW-degrading membrane proteinase PrsW (M82 family)
MIYNVIQKEKIKLNCFYFKWATNVTFFFFVIVICLYFIFLNYICLFVNMIVNFLFFLHYKKKLPLFNIVINNCEPISISLESTFFFIKKKKSQPSSRWVVYLCLLCGLYFALYVVGFSLSSRLLCWHLTPEKYYVYDSLWHVPLL